MISAYADSQSRIRESLTTCGDEAAFGGAFVGEARWFFDFAEVGTLVRVI
ncbi:MAG: hypothetical protein IT320_02740 [Anaerolineae bacterium]|nr:hypothetical protein [Anaerolineae bacterium]